MVSDISRGGKLMTSSGKKSSKLQTRTNIKGILFILPNLLGFLVFTAFPLVFSFVLSFSDWDAITDIRFIGLDNYFRMFKDEGFRISLFNTLYYMIASVPLMVGSGLVLALMLNSKVKLKKYYNTVFFMPNISSIVAMSIVWQAMYHPTRGPINLALQSIGISDPPLWTSSVNWAMPSVILMSVWLNAGYYMVLYSAALKGIPESLYEAADIDGANMRQKIFKITIPMLSPTTFFAIIMAIINSFKVFDQILLMTDGGPGRATNVLVYYIYRQSFSYYKFGYASAVSYVLFFIVFALTAFQYKGQKKWVNYM